MIGLIKYIAGGGERGVEIPSHPYVLGALAWEQICDRYVAHVDRLVNWWIGRLERC